MAVIISRQRLFRLIALISGLLSAALILFDYRIALLLAGIAFLLFGFFLRPVLLLGLIVLLVPLPNWAGAFRLGFALNWYNLLFFLVFASWFVRKVAGRENLWVDSALSRPFLVFILVWIYSLFRAAIGPFPVSTWENFIWLKRILFDLFLFFLFLEVVEKEGEIKFLVGLIVLMIAVEAVVCYQQRVDLSNAVNFDWSLKQLRGTFGVPIYGDFMTNEVGAFFGQLITFLIGLSLGLSSWILRFVLWGVSIFAFQPFLWTFSRGAWLAAAAGIAFLGIIRSRWLLVLLLGFVVVAPRILPSAIVERASIVETETGEIEHSAEMRKIIAREVFQAMKSAQNAFFGVGLNQAAVYLNKDAHNVYLRFLLEFGVFGLLVFLWLLIACFRLGWRVYREGNSEFSRALALGYLGFFVVLAVVNLTGTRLMYGPITDYFWILSGMLARIEANTLQATSHSL